MYFYSYIFNIHWEKARRMWLNFELKINLITDLRVKTYENTWDSSKKSNILIKMVIKNSSKLHPHYKLKYTT